MHVQRFLLPLPPSVNALYLPVNGQQILSPLGRAFKDGVAKMLEGRSSGPRSGLISLQADVFRARKSGDLANIEKALGDVLNGVAYADDSQTVEIRLRRFEDPEFPRVQVTVTELDGELAPPPRWRFTDRARELQFGLVVAAMERVRDAARLKRNAPAAAEALFATSAKPRVLPAQKDETVKERLLRMAKSATYRR